MSEIGILVPSTNAFNIITVGHMKRIRTCGTGKFCVFNLCFELRTVSLLTLIPSCNLCDSIYTARSMIMQRVIFRHFPFLTVLNSGEFGIMFSGIPTTTFGASIVMSHFSLLVSARVLDDFRGISCFVFFIT